MAARTHPPISSSEKVSTGSETVWMNWLSRRRDPLPALRTFSRHYHYFSIHQVTAFSRLFQALPVTERESLALLADVLHEELGRGRPDRVHSILFERFAHAVGVDVSTLPLASSVVAPGVRWYVAELELGFGGGSLAAALATYLFLESSAVQTYPPLLALLRSFGLGEADLEFFSLHAAVEVEHAEAAQAMVRRAGLSPGDVEFNEQTALLRQVWERFWVDILAVSRIETGDA